VILPGGVIDLGWLDPHLVLTGWLSSLRYNASNNAKDIQYQIHQSRLPNYHKLHQPNLNNRYNVTMSTSIEHLQTNPLTAQERFAQNVDLNQPEKAMTSYQELMHQHTMQQSKSATTSSCSVPSEMSGTPPALLKSDSTCTTSSVSSVSTVNSAAR
jgi:hypothetical protein